MKGLAKLSMAGLFLGLAWTASAAEIQGVLMDKMCSSNALKDPAFASKHDTKCALQPPCTASGYGVFTSDNKFLTFDKAGNAKALAALKATKKTDNLMVTVNGDVSGSTIKVASLKLD